VKPIYTVFSRLIFLNVIAILMLCFTAQMTYYFVLNLIVESWNYYFVNGNFIVLFAYLLLLVFDVWILTATLLPIIKIDNSGVCAYSIFWRRFIKWEEIQSVKLLQSGSKSSRYAMGVSFTIVNAPITKSSFSNKGVRLNTFILVCKSKFKMPEDLSTMGLLTHNKIVDKNAIAFEFSANAWHCIQARVDNKSNFSTIA
jgi:hypothetical protein